MRSFCICMEVIRSADNGTVKKLNKLKQKKYRDEFGEFFVEGYRNVCDTLMSNPDSVRSVILGESAFGVYGGEFSRFDPIVLSDALFDRIAETDSSQGVISINRQKPSEFPVGRCVLLDRVRDPGNVGTIIRTAIAAGYDVVLNNCADLYSPKVVRSAMSAILKCRIGIDIPAKELKDGGFKLIVADMNGDNVFKAPPETDKFCIIIGNEANGVSEELRAAADRTLAIPQDGIESLNAAVAAGIMMFAMRQNN